MWVATGSGTNSLAYSYDGINWTGLGTGIFSTYGNSVSSYSSPNLYPPITPSNDGDTLYPKARYQENFNSFQDKVDVTYRQNPYNNTSTYYLYYSTVGGNTTGTYTSPPSGSNVLNANWIGDWSDNAFVSNVNIPSNTQIDFSLRSGSGPDNPHITWTSWQTLGTIDSSGGTGDRTYTVTKDNMPDSSSLPIDTSSYLQVQIVLKSNDGISVPTLYDYSLNYETDENAPTWDYPVSIPV
jgi:hypothetical protein